MLQMVPCIMIFLGRKDAIEQTARLSKIADNPPQYDQIEVLEKIIPCLDKSISHLIMTNPLNEEVFDQWKSNLTFVTYLNSFQLILAGIVHLLAIPYALCSQRIKVDCDMESVIDQGKVFLKSYMKFN